MNYTMTEPCKQCPFLIGNGYTLKSLKAHASGPFPCHKTCTINEETGDFEPTKKSAHCAGALIFLELQNASHQMMRIVERLGMYDRTQLNMSANVVHVDLIPKKRKQR